MSTLRVAITVRCEGESLGTMHVDLAPVDQPIVGLEFPAPVLPRQYRRKRVTYELRFEPCLEIERSSPAPSAS